VGLFGKHGDVLLKELNVVLRNFARALRREPVANHPVHFLGIGARVESNLGGGFLHISQQGLRRLGVLTTGVIRGQCQLASTACRGIVGDETG
jgi:hypothetical protein